MKKSILTAALIASFSGAVSAQVAESPQPLTDTITWKGKVPAIVVANNSMSISSLTGSLDDAVLTFTRTSDGSLTLEPTVAESFQVVNKAGKAIQYSVTLSSVSATYSNSSGESHKLIEGSAQVKRNDKVMTVGTAQEANVGKSSFTLEFTEDALTELGKQEDTQVVVIATVMVSATGSSL
ncbi:hypothetical protein [Vibrio sp. Y29_XK_CS5]|uniref:hypothetical protein n=1 Tax=Vibrio sp. Y29_XK_CS5 TaxID=2957762 RepID=UPI0020A5F34F|nr:hypothetical protein [Vibrio sp. Y29_XK_CS5]